MNWELLERSLPIVNWEPLERSLPVVKWEPLERSLAVVNWEPLERSLPVVKWEPLERSLPVVNWKPLERSLAVVNWEPLGRSLPVVSVLRVPPESSTQGLSCVFAGVVLRRTQDLVVQRRLQNSTSAVATGTEWTNRERRSLPVRTLDLGWSSDAKTPQAQSLLVASSSVCVFFFTHWLGLHKKRWQGSSKDFPKHFNFQPSHWFKL